MRSSLKKQRDEHEVCSKKSTEDLDRSKVFGGKEMDPDYVKTERK